MATASTCTTSPSGRLRCCRSVAALLQCCSAASCAAPPTHAHPFTRRGRAQRACAPAPAGGRVCGARACPAATRKARAHQLLAQAPAARPSPPLQLSAAADDSRYLVWGLELMEGVFDRFLCLPVRRAARPARAQWQRACGRPGGPQVCARRLWRALGCDKRLAPSGMHPAGRRQARAARAPILLLTRARPRMHPTHAPRRPSAVAAACAGR